MFTPTVLGYTLVDRIWRLFYYPIKSLLLEMKCVLKHHDMQNCLISIYANMGNFRPLEVVGRASGTQLQMGEYLI